MSQPIPSPGFFAGGGEVGALMRGHEWTGTPLGLPEHWPQSLKTVVNIVLTSRYAMWMCWGEKFSFLYNDAYRPTLGIKHPWALGRPAYEVWAEIWHEIGPRIESVLATGEATYEEGLLLFLQRSGFPEETYHTFSYSPLADDGGSICGMLCVVTEETERVIGERRMATLRDLAADLAASNTEHEVLAAIERQLGQNPKDLPFTLLYLYDDDGTARLCLSTNMPPRHSLAPHRLDPGTNFPWPAADVLLRSTSRLVTDLGSRSEDAALLNGAWDRSPEQAAVVPIRQQGNERPAGFLVVGLNPYRRYDEAYSGFVDIVAGQCAAGISNARAYEEERRRAEALAELDRAKTTFFSNVSHEFRTPLTLMLGPVEDLLGTPDGLTQEDRGQLEMVHRNGLRLQRLVNNLLDFSRIEAGRTQAKYQATDLAVLTADLASSFRSAMERANLRFLVECAPLPQSVYIDREMWEKVVLNLISNAFKYTLEGSVMVALHDRGGKAELSVADTGVGIPSNELPKLFDRFHRVEQTHGRTHEGSGIGLALVQELVTLHGGTVSVESAPGKGSTFTVSIPFGTGHLSPERVDLRDRVLEVNANAAHASSYVAEALRWLPEAGGAAHPEGTRAIGDAPGLKSPESVRSRILLADDNADLRDYVRRLLSEKYSVIAVSNGQDALDEALVNPPDLILSDVMMPGLDGVELLHAVRAHPATRAVPLILLSARAGEQASVEALESGADDYLVKPFSAKELLARVGAHLALRRERQRAHEQLTRVFSQAPVAIGVFRGRDLVIELANPIYQEMLRGRELVGRPLTQAVPEIGHNVLDAMHSVLDTGQPFVATDFLVPYDKDGDGVSEDHWFNVVYHPLTDPDGTIAGVIGILNEVTTQVQARLGLERVNRELEEFAYAASHDLQEPLRMINIYSQLLLRRYMSKDEEAALYAGFVQDGVRRMEQLITDLLSYSRVVHRDQEDPQAADLKEALDEALSVLKVRIAETGATVVAGPLPVVLGESRQLSLVFQNLISNALKYRAANASPRIEISAREAEDNWTVTVTDNGIGFESKYAEIIFGLFKRLHKDDSYSGTGLGLAICRRIIERYGGRIWASSEGKDQGATFSFSLKKATR